MRDRPELLASFDPGLETGVIVAALPEPESTVMKLVDVTTLQGGVKGLPSFMPTLIEAAMVINSETAITIVCEDYKVRIDPRQGGFAHRYVRPPAVEVIGALMYWSYLNEFGDIHFQQALVKREGFTYLGIDPETVKKTPKSKSHTQDALSHLAYFLVKNRGFDPLYFKETT